MRLLLVLALALSSCGYPQPADVPDESSLIDAGSDDANLSDASPLDAIADGAPSDACECGSCTDVSTDELNCGECGLVCGTGTVCSAGSCVDACPLPAQPHDVIAIEVSPTGGNLVAGVTATVPIQVVGYYRDDPWSAINVTSLATFESSDPAVVAVTPGGVASSPAGTPGFAQITIAVGTVSSTITVRVWDPVRFAAITTLTGTLGGGWSTFGLDNGECFPVSVVATFADSSTENVSATIDWGVYVGATNVHAGRVIDQNLFVITGFPNVDHASSGYANLIGTLTPGATIQANFNNYISSQIAPYGGTCSDPRSPGPVLAVFTNREGPHQPVQPQLEVGEAVQYATHAFHADHTIRDVGNIAALRTCDTGGVEVTADGWVTGLATGSHQIGASHGGELGVSTITVVPAQTHATMTDYFLSPAAVNVPAGSSYRLAAFARYQGTGTRTFNVSSLSTWSSSDHAIASDPDDGGGTVTSTLGTAAVHAALGAFAADGSVRSWDPARLASITALTGGGPQVDQSKCAQLGMVATFNGSPGDTEQLAGNLTWTRLGTCFGSVTTSGYWWSNGPFCSSFGYVTVKHTMGHGLPGGLIIMSGASNTSLADNYRDPATCTP